MNPSVYLAGPITGLTWKKTLAWRETAEKALSPMWKVYNPIHTQLPNITDMNDIALGSKQTDNCFQPIHFTGSGIVSADESMIRKCDWLLVNFTQSKQISPGTMWEMGLAWGLNKMIITALDPTDPHDNIFVRRRSHIFVPTIREAIEYLRDLRL